MADAKQPYVRNDERRAMIASAARELIVRNGLAALRTRDVAAAIGINISTLHFHIPTKAALVALVAETTLQAFLDLLPPAPDPEQPAREQLYAEARAYHDSVRDHPELAASFAQLQMGTSEPEIVMMLDSFSEGWCRRYAEILGIGRTQGMFRHDLDPLAAALAMTGALTAFGLRSTKGLGMFWPVFNEIERGFLSR